MHPQSLYSDVILEPATNRSAGPAEESEAFRVNFLCVANKSQRPPASTQLSEMVHVVKYACLHETVEVLFGTRETLKTETLNFILRFPVLGEYSSLAPILSVLSSVRSRRFGSVFLFGNDPACLN